MGENISAVSSTMVMGENISAVSGTAVAGVNISAVSGTMVMGQNTSAVSGTVVTAGNSTNSMVTVFHKSADSAMVVMVCTYRATSVGHSGCGHYESGTEVLIKQHKFDFKRGFIHEAL
ncbi:hypothetical protein BaRGS_00032241 [Batillaria attramentaria]|uniref:Uncharacterized protein n=1 Tax=Batillaria attramentaria TaxID=370345 RepID=A0ABD0JNX5_9CAEN